MECGRYSASILEKTEGRRISKYPDTLATQKYIAVFDVAGNKRHAPRSA